MVIKTEYLDLKISFFDKINYMFILFRATDNVYLSNGVSLNTMFVQG